MVVIVSGRAGGGGSVIPEVNADRIRTIGLGLIMDGNVSSEMWGGKQLVFNASGQSGLVFDLPGHQLG